MKPLLHSLKDFVLLILLCIIILVSINNLSLGMTTGVFFDGIGNLQYSFFGGFLGLLCICLQLAAMRWSTYALNTLLTVFSVLLFTEMVTLAFGPAIAQTPAVHQQAVSAGVGNVFSINSALYWLIPLCWFVALLGAKHQVRIFCMALVCYTLWIVFTPMLNNIVAKCASQGTSLFQQTFNILSGAEWMPAVALGCFLLLFSLIVDLLETIFPEKKKQTEPTAPNAEGKAI